MSLMLMLGDTKLYAEEEEDDSSFWSVICR